jgi:hypothetical protein
MHTALFADQSIRNDWQIITLMYLEIFGYAGAATELTKAIRAAASTFKQRR